MKISAISQQYNNEPGFKSAYSVKGVTLNGEYYGKNRDYTVYKVTKALYNKMRQRTLSAELLKKINDIFPDFRTHPFVYVGRMIGEDIYKRRTNLLTGYDAEEYKNALAVETTQEGRNWVLNRILKREGYKRITISAEENNGVITITDIERV